MGATSTINPEKILKDLRDLWAKLGTEHGHSSGVLRACAMTLIVVVEDTAAAESVRKILGAVMHEHPCRAIVLRMLAGAEPGARVFSECWTPRGGQTQICAEGIELTADASNPTGAAQLILPLLVADLPVVLWRDGRFDLPDELLRLAQKVIVDSDSLADGGGAEAGIEGVRALRARGYRVADLAWTRLTGWREAVANAFGCKKWSATNEASVRIGFGGESSTGVLYFKRWIERALPKSRVTIESGPGEPGIHSVTISDAISKEEVSLTLAGTKSIEVRAGDCSARSPLPPAGDDALLCEELSILGEDPVFESLL